MTDRNRDVKILGAQPTNPVGKPRVLDGRTKQTQIPVEVTQHGEKVTVKSHVRAKPARKDEPEVRLQLMTREERERWNSIRQVEWED